MHRIYGPAVRFAMPSPQTLMAEYFLDRTEALTEIARTYAVSHSTISRLAAREAVVANLQPG